MKYGRNRVGRLASGVPRRWRVAAYVCVSASAVFMLFAFNPATSKLFPPCPFRALTGLNCPGCGTLRALHQLLHGNLRAAFRLNPLMLVSLAWVAYAFAARALAATGRPLLPEMNFRGGWYWFYAALVVAFWVFRNTPYYPLACFARLF
jgi:hypothetical protein